MHLVYLWVENYRCFHETGIHFTNRCEINVEKSWNETQRKSIYLVKVKNRQNALNAENFYGKGISDFRIFVAENGRGKTTLFELLDMILKKRYEYINTSIILGVGTKGENGEEEIKFGTIHLSTGDVYLLNGEYNGRLSFLTEQERDGIEYAIHYNDPDKEKRLESIKHQIDFVCQHTEKELNRWLKFPIPPRLMVQFNLGWDGLRQFRNMLTATHVENTNLNHTNVFSKKVEALNGIIGNFKWEYDRWINSICEELGKEKIEDILHGIGEVALYTYLKNGRMGYQEEVENSQAIIESWEQKVIDDREHRMNIGRTNVWNRIINVFEEGFVYNKDKWEKLKAVVEQLKNIDEELGNQYTEGLVLKIHEDSNVDTGAEALKKLNAFYEAYANFVGGQSDFEFLSFSWGMSSGEQSMLNTFSHIYQFQKNWNDEGTYILMLDEIDLSLHPRWQQEYMQRLKTFMEETLGENRKVQLILATHSPIVLSDVPGDFITYLSGKEKGKIFSKEDTNTRQRKTFGANIYDIYNDAFYFNVDDQGVIGGIAAKKFRKIKENLKHIDEKTEEEQEKLLEECRREIEYFDDDILKRLLLGLWKSALQKCNLKNVKMVQEYLESLPLEKFQEFQKLLDNWKAGKVQEKEETV